MQLYAQLGNIFQALDDISEAIDGIITGIIIATIIAIIVIVAIGVIAGAGVGALIGSTAKKLSDDADLEGEAGDQSVYDAPTSSPKSSGVKGCAYVLVGSVVGIIFVLATVFSSLIATDKYDLNSGWLLIGGIVGSILGVLWAARYENGRAERIGKDKARKTSFLGRLLVAAFIAGGIAGVLAISLTYMAFKPEKRRPEQVRQHDEERNARLAVREDPHDNMTFLELDSRGAQQDSEQFGKLRANLRKHVLENEQHIRGMELYGPAVTNEIFEELYRLENLEELYIASNLVDDSVLEHLGKIDSLKKLVIDAPIYGKGLHHLKNLNNLTELDIAYTKVTAENLIELAGCNLETLQIPELSKSDLGLEHYFASTKGRQFIDLDDWNNLKGPGLSHLQAWLQSSQKESPWLDESYEVVKGFRILPLDSSIEELAQEAKELNRVVNLPQHLRDGNGRAIVLKAYGSRSALEISWLTFDDDQLQFLSNCKDLQYLDLSATNIRVDALSYLAELEHLRILLVGFGEVNSHVLTRLNQIASLETLTLGGEVLTDDSIPLFQKFTNLTTLNLNIGFVSKAQRKQLRKVLSDCKIILRLPSGDKVAL